MPAAGTGVAGIVAVAVAVVVAAVVVAVAGSPRASLCSDSDRVPLIYYLAWPLVLKSPNLVEQRVSVGHTARFEYVRRWRLQRVIPLMMMRSDL